MTTHELKTWPEYFDAVKRRDKPFEIRKDDRGFRTGDLLVLRKWCPDVERWLTPDGQATGEAECADTVYARVSHVLTGRGIEPGYVAMGLSIVEPMTADMIRGYENTNLPSELTVTDECHARLADPEVHEPPPDAPVDLFKTEGRAPAPTLTAHDIDLALARGMADRTNEDSARRCIPHRATAEDFMPALPIIDEDEQAVDRLVRQRSRSRTGRTRLLDAYVAAGHAHVTGPRYTLLCWDTGDRLSEVRYKGPFNDEAEAGKYLETLGYDPAQTEGWRLRRCRRVTVSELLPYFDDMVSELDLWAGDGNLHESAWAHWDESIVTTKDEASIRRALAEALAPHLTIDVYICEGDEEMAP